MPLDLPQQLPDDARPFRGLLAAWSLVVVILAVAGFSSRWNYYYNFGLQSLVLQAPLTSLPVYAIEIIRNKDNLATFFWPAAKYLLIFEIIYLFAKLAGSTFREKIEEWYPAPQHGFGALIHRLLAWDSRLIVDAIRAALIIYIAFVGGGNAGTNDYRVNVLEQTSRLPKITAIASPSKSDGKETGPGLPVSCDTRPLTERPTRAEPAFIGDPLMLRFLIAGAACSSDGRSWRLLFRDDKFVYIFATITDPGTRPDTLVIPNDDKLILVLR